MWVTEMSDATHAHRNRLRLTPTATHSHTNYFRCRRFQASIFVFICCGLSYFKSSVQLSATLCADTLSMLFIFTLKAHLSFNTSCLVQGKGGKRSEHIYSRQGTTNWNKTAFIENLSLKRWHVSAPRAAPLPSGLGWIGCYRRQKWHKRRSLKPSSHLFIMVKSSGYRKEEGRHRINACCVMKKRFSEPRSFSFINGGNHPVTQLKGGRLHTHMHVHTHTCINYMTYGNQTTTWQTGIGLFTAFLKVFMTPSPP